MEKPKLEVSAFGTKRYYLNGELHREDGPAIECFNGTKHWFLNGKPHRYDGPAIEYNTGNKYWYYHGKQIFCKTNEEFLRIIKLKMYF